MPKGMEVSLFPSPNISITYAKITQTRGKKVYFQLPECSLSYAKINNNNNNSKQIILIFYLMHIYSSTYPSVELNYPIIKKGSSTVLVHVIEAYHHFSYYYIRSNPDSR